MAGQDPKWQKDAADQNFDYMFKLLIIGNSSVGKTSFLFRYADDSFTSAFVSTVGIDFKVKTVFRHDKRVKLQIWVSIYMGHSMKFLSRSRYSPIEKRSPDYYCFFILQFLQPSAFQIRINWFLKKHKFIWKSSKMYKKSSSPKRSRFHKSETENSKNFPSSNNIVRSSFIWRR